MLWLTGYTPISERSIGNRLATYPNSKIFWGYWDKIKDIISFYALSL